MITVTLLALAYVIAVTVFMAWAKAHAPEGREEYELGFIYSPATSESVKPVKAPVARRPVLTEGLTLAR
jgi:hypothetical protein